MSAAISDQLARLEAAADRLTAQGNVLIEEGKSLQTAARELRGQVARLTHLVINDDHVEIRVERNGGPPAPTPSPEPVAPPPPDIPEVHARSVGRFGEVNKETAQKLAQQLGEFTRAQFAERSGLVGATPTRWLTLLVGEGYLRFSRGKYRVLVAPPVRDWVVWHKDEYLAVEDVARMCQLTVEDARAELESLAKRDIVTCQDGLYRYKPVESWQGPKEHETKVPPERLRPSYDLAPPDRGLPVRVAAVKKATRRQRSTAGAGGIKGPKQTDARYKRMQEAKAKRASEQKDKTNGRQKKAA